MAENNAPGGGSFVMTRTFDAPRDLVYKAWTEAERLEQWWGPKGFIVRVAKLELRPGGTFHYAMESPDHGTFWGKFVYREVLPPERLVFVVSFTDAEANPVRHPMSPTWPLEVLSTVTLSEHEGKTTLRMESVPVNATDEERSTFQEGLESLRQGTAGALDQLAAYLAQG